MSAEELAAAAATTYGDNASVETAASSSPKAEHVPDEIQSITAAAAAIPAASTKPDVCQNKALS